MTIHCVSKKVPTFEHSVTLSNLKQFAKFLHCWKAYEICYKPIRQHPPHLEHVATLAWELKNSNFLQIFNRYGRNANMYVIHHTLYVVAYKKSAQICN